MSTGASPLAGLWDRVLGSGRSGQASGGAGLGCPDRDPARSGQSEHGATGRPPPDASGLVCSDRPDSRLAGSEQAKGSPRLGCSDRPDRIAAGGAPGAASTNVSLPDADGPPFASRPSCGRRCPPEGLLACPDVKPEPAAPTCWVDLPDPRTAPLAACVGCRFVAPTGSDGRCGACASGMVEVLRRRPR
jgi:hypothetical protein